MRNSRSSCARAQGPQKKWACVVQCSSGSTEQFRDKYHQGSVIAHLVPTTDFSLVLTHTSHMCICACRLPIPALPQSRCTELPAGCTSPAKLLWWGQQTSKGTACHIRGRGNDRLAFQSSTASNHATLYRVNQTHSRCCGTTQGERQQGSSAKCAWHVLQTKKQAWQATPNAVRIPEWNAEPLLRLNIHNFSVSCSWAATKKTGRPVLMYIKQVR
jgi:hypothetical protein